MKFIDFSKFIGSLVDNQNFEYLSHFILDFHWVNDRLHK